ncbi:restriction endonuclease subunit S [Burkholderia stagnalis]|uniref:restriction endonuclease subunit S n=1 Tax=Burkholderia stagnalis TaxID=1503054 RepID=UPI000F5F2669|nr:restriction endonuclease subunit S [Burkholderia stagnalis]RQY65627.1 restriction endonuclease subunit S [Burkholderia stagnalis]
MKLPDTWVQARLTEVCQLNPRLLAADRPGDETDVTFVPMSAVDEIQGAITKPEIRKVGEVAKGYTNFRERDVLFAKVTPCMENGKAAIAQDLVGGMGFGSTEFHVLRPTDAILPEYLFGFIRQQAFRDRAASAFVGTGGLQRVPPDFLHRVKLPLPTLREQERIVGILRLAEAAIQNQYSRRQQLDSMIKAELDRLVLACGADEWERLGRMVETRYGTSVSADATAESGTAVLRIPNVMGGEVDTERLKYVDLPKAELDRLSLTTADVLIVRSNGNPEYVGRSAPITEDVAQSPVVYASYLIRLRADTSRLLPEYLSAFLNSAYGRAAMRNAIRTTAGQSNLSGESLTKLRVPVPSLSEQERFRAFWLQVRRLRQLIAKSEKDANALLAELRIHAFSGDLTSGWRAESAADIDEAARARDGLLRMHSGTAAVRDRSDDDVIAKTDLAVRPARHWLWGELSEFQRQVHSAFTAYFNQNSQPLLVEDPEIFANFCENATVTEHLRGFGSLHGNRIRRSLSQLAALGLLAKVTLPKEDPESGELEYLKAFRPLRPEEFTRLADVQALRKALARDMDGESP